MRDVGWGVLGAGWLVTRATGEALRSAAGARVVAAGARDLDRARSVGALRAYDSYRAVIEDPDVEAVYICLANDAHLPMIRMCIEAGKHVLCEKPMVLSAADAESVFEQAAEAGVLLVEATWSRWHPRMRRIVELVADGAIGDITSIYTNYFTGPVKPMPPASARPADISDVDWQVRNWYNFSWISGDGLVEQAVHSIDKMCWVMKDVPPVSCVSNGGRAVAANGGNIFDHISVYYKYANGVFAHHGCRQIPGAWGQNADFINGTKGRLIIGAGAVRIEGENAWRAKGAENDMYQQEHTELFASIRKGEGRNDGEWLAKSTLTAIMGRMAAYTGQEVTWEQAINAQHNLLPEGVTMDNLTWDQKLDHIPLAIPGRTKQG